MIVGYYNRLGYRIESNGRELYCAGNHPLDSSVILDADDPGALLLATIKKYCRQTAKELSAERKEPIIGVKLLKE